MRTLTRAKITGLVTVAAVVGTAGMAMAGTLPAPAQDALSHVLSKVGITVPAADHPATPGAVISSIATDPATTGLAKGAAVSTAASGGKSHAGQPHPGGNGANPTPHTHGGTVPTPPVTTPNPGGTGTGDTASGGSSSNGTGTAGTVSGSHSDAGSGNVPSR